MEAVKRKTNKQTLTNRLRHQQLDIFFSDVEDNDFWV